MEYEQLLEIPHDAGQHRARWEKVLSPQTVELFRKKHQREPQSREELVSFYPRLMREYRQQ